MAACSAPKTRIEHDKTRARTSLSCLYLGPCCPILLSASSALHHLANKLLKRTSCSASSRGVEQATCDRTEKAPFKTLRLPGCRWVLFQFAYHFNTYTRAVAPTTRAVAPTTRPPLAAMWRGRTAGSRSLKRPADPVDGWTLEADG